MAIGGKNTMMTIKMAKELNKLEIRQEIAEEKGDYKEWERIQKRIEKILRQAVEQ